MTPEQFKLVKLIQRIGVKAKAFAKACDVAPELMEAAYDSANYEQLKVFSKVWGVKP